MSSRKRSERNDPHPRSELPALHRCPSRAWDRLAGHRGDWDSDRADQEVLLARAAGRVGTVLCPRRHVLSVRQFFEPGPAGAVRRDVSAVLRDTRNLCPVRHGLRRLRIDRERSAIERAPDLSVEAVDPGRVCGGQARDLAVLSAPGDPGAGADASVPGDDVLRQLGVCRCEPVPASSHHALRPGRGPAVCVHHAGAVIALDQRPLHRHALCGRRTVHGRGVWHRERHHQQFVARLALVSGEPGSDWRCHLPASAAIRVAVAAVGRRGGVADRSVGVGARATRAGRGGGDVSVPVVAADRVSKWYGQVIGLNDITVDVRPGVTGLLGPNGAGKSTFLKLITGQLKPSKGTIRVLGEPIWGNPGLYRRLGFCPEQYSFYERMTGLQWVTALVRLNGLSDTAATEAARQALDTVGLLDAADKKIGAYSKGMRQRVKLAQAVVHDPDVLVLDEPLAGMDPIARRKVIRLIKGWGREGKSVLVSSHILHEIESMTSTILLINNGRILAEGNIHQIRDLIDEHPHTVKIRADDPRRLAHAFIEHDGVRSLTFEEGAVVVETGKPDAFYGQLTQIAASGELGEVHEVSSPDDDLQAVFEYLVK
ncbi:MAG TPA: ABC transporter ATP-binding protein [Acidobacteria bacterium]|nr:ABC transporter ATP-binding protein [Acidobacteriota bacterium]